MAEPPAVTPSAVAAAEQDVLLATKLHVPGPQPGFVGRPRLAEALDKGLARGLIPVCAPAGFGKTALLADWVRRGDRPVAWLSLDAGDNDPARFWRHVVAALGRVHRGPGLTKQYGAGKTTTLQIETVINDARDVACNRRLHNLDKLRARACDQWPRAGH